jgi:hypothetical protein
MFNLYIYISWSAVFCFMEEQEVSVDNHLSNVSYRQIDHIPRYRLDLTSDAQRTPSFNGDIHLILRMQMISNYRTIATMKVPSHVVIYIDNIRTLSENTNICMSAKQSLK